VTQAEPNPPNWPAGVYVFDPSTPSHTQSVVDQAFAQNGGHVPPFNGQWSTGRYAFLFKPGDHRVSVNVGFYTQIMGLGAAPTDTTIPTVTVQNGDFDYQGGALDNFWRSVENIATGPMLWAVSQASPLRRMDITGSLSLYQYNSGCCAGFASGGFMADMRVSQSIISGSQQQFFTRNTDLGKWLGGVWNMVFVGNSGEQLKDHCGISGDQYPYTVIAQTPVIAEKPYITIDNGGKFTLRVPPLEKNKVGPTQNYGDGESIDFSKVYVSSPSDSASVINGKLASGLHLVIGPGFYNLSAPITITRANTVVLGIGFPTLVATNGNPVIHVKDVDGVRVAGFIFDAGRITSNTLIQWGDSNNFGDPNNPGILYDAFGRVGGTNNPAQFQVSTKEMVTINHAHVIIDNSWLWRADHDVAGIVKNSDNPSQNGLVVNGDNAITYGLAAEHHLRDAVVWNGEGGRTYFYQCEFPYDVTQQEFGNPGYAGYRVNPSVTSHTSWGAGVYSYFRDYTVVANSGIVAPTRGGVTFIHPFTRFLNGNGAITHVLNKLGNPVNTSSPLAYVCSP